MHWLINSAGNWKTLSQLNLYTDKVAVSPLPAVLWASLDVMTVPSWQALSRHRSFLPVSGQEGFASSSFPHSWCCVPSWHIFLVSHLWTNVDFYSTECVWYERLEVWVNICRNEGNKPFSHPINCITLKLLATLTSFLCFQTEHTGLSHKLWLSPVL